MRFPAHVMEAAAGLKNSSDPLTDARRLLGEPSYPHWRAAIASIPSPALWTANGWLLLCCGLALRYGSWLLVTGLGLGMLLAGLGVMARDAVAKWMLAYYSPAGEKEER